MKEQIETTAATMARKLDLLERAVNNAKRRLLAGSVPTDDFGTTLGKTALSVDVAGAQLYALATALDTEDLEELDALCRSIKAGAARGTSTSSIL